MALPTEIKQLQDNGRLNTAKSKPTFASFLVLPVL
jgi:hypothetical protein